MARKITVDSNRRLYIADQLNQCEYTRQNAEYAEVWLLFGDWSLKGSDPTLTLDDFFPSQKQYDSGFAKKHMRQSARKQSFEPMQKAFATEWMTEDEKRDMAIWIIRDKEPVWGFKLDVPWIRQYDALASTMEPIEQANTKREYIRPMPEFEEFKRQYIQNDGFMHG